MRMRELESHSGFPRSTIHFYLREGVLSPPEKTSRNAAVYSDEHLKDLAVIRVVRAYDEAMPVASVKRIVALARQGIEPELAMALEKVVAGDADEDPLQRLDVPARSLFEDLFTWISPAAASEGE